MTVWTLTPTTNVLLALHWAARARLRDEWYYLIKIAAQEFEIPLQTPGERRDLEIVSYRLQEADYDNLEGGMKFLIDALVRGNFLADDAPRFFVQKPKISQIIVKRRKEQKTRIYLRVPDPEDPGINFTEGGSL